jgi:hypothetical protein
MSSDVEIRVSCTDIRDVPVNYVVVKNARNASGAGKAVARSLNILGEVEDDSPELPMVGDWDVYSGEGISAEYAIIGSVKRIPYFGYDDIRWFSRQSLELAEKESDAAERIAHTIHGPGYGLDLREAFESQLAGFSGAIKSENAPSGLEQIVIAERSEQRAEKLREIRNQFLDGTTIHREEPQTKREQATGYDSEGKPRIFVAMPFDDGHEDVYRSGIDQVVEDLRREDGADLLCERVDEAVFTGSITEELKQRIEDASLVVADLTGANPNVYLEVGYAWAADVPTVLLAQDTEEDLKFDVEDQNAIIYDRKHLYGMRNELKETLRNLDHIQTE